MTDSPPNLPARPVAAFDFDGTLTYKDSFTAFLYDSCGFFRVAVTFLTSPDLWLPYLLTGDRGVLKARLIYKLLGPIARAKLDGRVAQFISGRGIALFRPDARAEWDRCRQAGYERVIVTASPEILVAPFGRGLGAEAVIGTRLSVSPEGFITGALNGPNCRGPEKVVRLEAAYGQGVRLEAAYGDSDGDTAMLAISDQPGMKVFGERP